MDTEREWKLMGPTRQPVVTLVSGREYPSIANDHADGTFIY